MQKFWKASSFFDKRFAQDEKSLEKITLYEIIKEIKVDDFFSNVTLSELKDQVEQLFEQESLRPDLINLQLVQELAWGSRDSDDYPKYYLVGARLESDTEWKTRLDKNANEVSLEQLKKNKIEEAEKEELARLKKKYESGT